MEGYFISAGLLSVLDDCSHMDEISKLPSWFTTEVTLKFLCYNIAPITTSSNLVSGRMIATTISPFSSNTSNLLFLLKPLSQT